MTFKALLGTKTDDKISTSVFLRNVTLAGIDSVNAPQQSRIEAWERLARDLDLNKLARTTNVIGLADVPAVASQMFAGKVQGRTVVDVNAQTPG